MTFILSWAVGELVGAPTAATVAHLTSDTVALLAISAVMLATLAVVLSTRLIRHTPHDPASVDRSPGASRVDDDDHVPSARESIPAVGN
jgi:hypothetical protein